MYIFRTVERIFMKIGDKIYNLAEELFPICRSLTGDGVRQTLDKLAEIYPVKQYSVKSGTRVFDWTVPKEWNIRDAYIMDENGNRIVDFLSCNLHVMGYSIPVNQIMTGKELEPYLYCLEEQEDAIPYITSYYSERWGFCVTAKQKYEIANSQQNYQVCIDSELKDGVLNYGEILIKGESEKEIFFSTYVCHPSMANNELSGPTVAIYLAKWIASLPKRRYSYRIVFLPETIGSITYLSTNLKQMQENMLAGFVLTCIGDEGDFSYIPSRYGDNLADKVASCVLKHSVKRFKEYSFLDRGSDERQYCSPFVDLPVCSVTKTKYGEFPEYHTSLDNMDFISAKGLGDSFEFYKTCIEALEFNDYYSIQCLCEPQLGKRGLYPTLSYKGSAEATRHMRNTIAYLDGKNDIFDICNLIHADVKTVIETIQLLANAKLCEKNT